MTMLVQQRQQASRARHMRMNVHRVHDWQLLNVTNSLMHHRKSVLSFLNRMSTFVTVDVIGKKRDKKELTTEEIKFVVDGFTSGAIADYQMSALLMAIVVRFFFKVIFLPIF